MRRDKIIQSIKKKINTGTFDSIKSLRQDDIKLDFSDANIKVEVIDNGETMIVHNVPIAKEIVQPYSDGMGMVEYHYKPKDAIEGIKSSYSPISISHPDKLFNEMTDVEQEDNMIGYMLRGYFDEKTSKHYADLFLFVDKTPKFFLDNIKAKKPNDVSIGFNADIEKDSGEFNGKKYDYVQNNIRLDHLAILQPDERGRASFPDGVGVGADSNDKKINRGNTMTDEFEQKYRDSVDDNLKLKQELASTKDSIEAKDVEIASLKEKFGDYDDLKAKADKFDEAEAEEKKAEEEKVDSLKADILKISDKDDTKVIIEGMDSKQLEAFKNSISGKSNGLPASGKQDSGDFYHPSFKAREEKVKNQYGSKE